MKGLSCRLLLLSPLLLAAGCGVSSIPSNGLFQIQLAIYPKLCVDVLDASTTEGEYLQPALCGNGLRSQDWHITPIGNGNGAVTFSDLNSNQCMSVQNIPPNSPDTAPGQDILQETCNTPGTDPDQTWKVQPAQGINGYWIISAASGQCLNIPYGMLDPTDSAYHMQQNTCNSGDPAEAWSLQPTPAGSTP